MRRPPSKPAAAATPPSPPAKPGPCVNHTYGRGGALAYLAAYDLHRARVFGRTEPRTGIAPFMTLVTQVMSQEPYASAKCVFWIVDNGSSHRGKKAADRLAAAFPNAVMIHTPVHASWLNQVEIYFSVVQRKLTQRLHRPRRGQGPAPRLRRPLQRHSAAVPVEVHHLRPGRSAGQARPAHRRSPGRILRRPGSPQGRGSTELHLCASGMRTRARTNQSCAAALLRDLGRSFPVVYSDRPPSAGHHVRGLPGRLRSAPVSRLPIAPTQTGPDVRSAGVSRWCSVGSQPPIDACSCAHSAG
ncbi:transposase [Streptomyces sp. CA-135486]|uniref:transposase n=1 Tax=Streptomyces sp. CA-135486 TaxID=3240049 RepID=UPI003D8D620A